MFVINVKTEGNHVQKIEKRQFDMTSISNGKSIE